MNDKNFFKKYWFHGLLCVIARAEDHGYFCGYVRIPRSHRYYRRNDAAMDLNLQVHGGITYNRKSLYRFTGGRLEGRWIGFDCGHHFDYYQPKSLEYVIDQLKKLTKQISQ